MRYVLVTTWDEVHPPFSTWSDGHRDAYAEYLDDLAERLAEADELLSRQDLAPPRTGRLVAGDGANPPVVRDWPYADGAHPVASFWVIEVPGEDRALEVAGDLSAAPGPRGPLRRPVEVRRVSGPFG